MTVYRSRLNLLSQNCEKTSFALLSSTLEREKLDLKKSFVTRLKLITIFHVDLKAVMACHFQFIGYQRGFAFFVINFTIVIENVVIFSIRKMS